MIARHLLLLMLAAAAIIGAAREPLAAPPREDAIRAIVALRSGVTNGVTRDEFRQLAAGVRTACDLMAELAAPPANNKERATCARLKGLLATVDQIYRHRFELCPTPGACVDYYPLYEELPLSSFDPLDAPIVQKQRDFLKLVEDIPGAYRPVTEGGVIDIERVGMRAGKPVIHLPEVISFVFSAIHAESDRAIAEMKSGLKASDHRPVHR